MLQVDDATLNATSLICNDAAEQKVESGSALQVHQNQNHERSHRQCGSSVGHQLTHQDCCLHLAIFSWIVCSGSQESQLALFGYEPAGEFSIPVGEHMGI